MRFVAAALIVRGAEVLICQRRADQPMALQWEFPGGKIEAGESAEEALARELDEELGIQATVGPRVTRTASANLFIPRSSERRASSSKVISFATAIPPSATAPLSVQRRY